MMSLTPWVTRLLMANGAMFLVTLSLGGIPTILGLVPSLVLFRPWTAITYMFLHAGFAHIFFNMLMLFFFGPRLESRLGGAQFFRLYFLSGLAAALLSFFTPHAFIIGASGAVFGVMYGYAKFWPRDKVLLFFVIPIEIRVLVISMAVIAVLGGFGFGSGGIAHLAHLGGFLGAFLFLKYSEHYSPAARFKRKTQAAPRRSPFASEKHDVSRWQGIRGEEMHPLNREELNRILDKISASGVASLTPKERGFLERFSTQH